MNAAGENAARAAGKVKIFMVTYFADNCVHTAFFMTETERDQFFAQAKRAGHDPVRGDKMLPPRYLRKCLDRENRRGK